MNNDYCDKAILLYWKIAVQKYFGFFVGEIT